jgi:tetratricopeptide (TPR) repeat protein
MKNFSLSVILSEAKPSPKRRRRRLRQNLTTAWRNTNKYCEALRCAQGDKLLIFALLLLFLCSTATAEIDPRLKQFAKLKRQQTEQLAAKLHLDVPREAREFFEAAEAGDYKTMSNSYARIQRLTGQLDSTITMPGYTNVLAVPIHETRCAYEFYHWDKRLLQEFADSILHSMPAGSIYFGGDDPGRFIITAVRDAARSPDIFIVTQNLLVDKRYTEYLRLTLGDRLWMPSTNDVQEAIDQYARELQARQKRGEPIPVNEQVDNSACTNIVAVVKINGIIAKKVFDHNKDKHEFYVEESYVIPWMYDCMEPYGLIFKLSKGTVVKLQPVVIDRDSKYWDGLTKQLLADPKFVNSKNPRATYARLRSAIGGLYDWRKLPDEAEAAQKQALQLWPAIPEANMRLAGLYMNRGDHDAAIAVLQKWQKLDPSNGMISQSIAQITSSKQTRPNLAQLEAAHAASPRNPQLVVRLAAAYQEYGRSEKIHALCDSYLAQTDLPADDMMQIAQFYLTLGQMDRSLSALKLITTRHPEDARAWYAIAIIRSAQGATDDALAALEIAIQLNPLFRSQATADQRLANLRSLPRFQQLTSPAPSQ